jgi:hypothetical protein
MDSGAYDIAVSFNTVNRRMSSDMSGPLSDKSDGTTTLAQGINTCFVVGKCPNKTPFFIAGFRETRAFLACFRASCPGGLTAQLNAENLFIVPSTANGFRATVSVMRSLDWGEGMSFHNFTLPEDRCVRFL